MINLLPVIAGVGLGMMIESPQKRKTALSLLNKVGMNAETLVKEFTKPNATNETVYTETEFK